MDNTNLQGKVARLLIGFFVLILAFTFVSRGADSISVAKVKTDTIKSGVLTSRVTMSGKINPIDDLSIALPGEIYVTDVKFSAGKKVKSGEVLLEFDIADVEAQLEKLRGNIEVINLRINEADSVMLNGESTAVEYARQALDYAYEDFRLLKDKLERNKEKSENDLSELTSNLEAELKNEPGSEPGAVSSARLVVENALLDYDNLENKLNESVKRAETDLKDAESSLDKAKSEYEKTLTETKKNLLELAEKKYDDALKALETIEENAELALQNARSAYEKALSGNILGESYESAQALENYTATNQKWNKIKIEARQEIREAKAELDEEKKRTDFTDEPEIKAAQNVIEAAEKSVKSATRALEDARQNQDEQLLSAERNINAAQLSLNKAVKDAENTIKKARESDTEMELSIAEQLVNAERSIESAKRNLEQAQKQELNSEEGDEKIKRQAQIDRTSLIFERRELERYIDSLNEVYQNDGKLLSPIDGTVKSIVNTGKTQSKIPIVVIDRNDLGFYYEGTLDEDSAEELAVGDEGTLSYRSEGKTREVGAKISEISAVDENGFVIVTATLPEGEYPAGVTAEFLISSDSERQDAVLPLSALRSGADGEYVLILKEIKTVLGTEHTVTQVPVTVVLRDSENMSVTSSLTKDNKVVISTDKAVFEGDRVRFEDS